MIFIDMDMPECCMNCPCINLINGEGNGDYCQITYDEVTGEEIAKHRPEWCPLKEEPKKEPEKVTCATCKHQSQLIIGEKKHPDKICNAQFWEGLRTAPHVIFHDLHEPIRCDHWEPKEEDKA